MPDGPISRVLMDVGAECDRHVELGWDAEHDDNHKLEHLVDMAGDHANAAARRSTMQEWDRKELVQAASLLVAAIAKLDRDKVRNHE